MGEKFTFVKRQELGQCECCQKNVYDNELFVEEDQKVYHFSCHNIMKKEDKAE